MIENIDKDYTRRNSYILSNSPAAIQARNSFQIISKLVGECDHSLVKLAEHDRIQLVWVPGHMVIDGNEIADELARQYSSNPLTEPEPALSISAEITSVVIRD
jgi:ribonuclease HI